MEISIVEYGIRFRHAYEPFCMQWTILFGHQGSRIVVTMYTVVRDGGSS